MQLFSRRQNPFDFQCLHTITLLDAASGFVERPSSDGGGCPSPDIADIASCCLLSANTSCGCGAGAEDPNAGAVELQAPCVGKCVGASGEAPGESRWSAHLGRPGFSCAQATYMGWSRASWLPSVGARSRAEGLMLLTPELEAAPALPAPPAWLRRSLMSCRAASSAADRGPARPPPPLPRVCRSRAPLPPPWLNQGSRPEEAVSGMRECKVGVIRVGVAPFEPAEDVHGLGTCCGKRSPPPLLERGNPKPAKARVCDTGASSCCGGPVGMHACCTGVVSFDGPADCNGVASPSLLSSSGSGSAIPAPGPRYLPDGVPLVGSVGVGLNRDRNGGGALPTPPPSRGEDEAAGLVCPSELDPVVLSPAPC